MINSIRRLFRRQPVVEIVQSGDVVIKVDKADLGVATGLHKGHVGVHSLDTNKTVIDAITQELATAKARGVSDDHPEIVAHRDELAARLKLHEARK